jgi:hypothetical protein
MNNFRDKRILDYIWARLVTPLTNLIPENALIPSNLVITEPLTLYVETTGDDAGLGTIDKPFRQIQAALEVLRGCDIRALVTIRVGLGTFNGFSIPKLNVTRGLLSGTTNQGGVVIQGTLAAATLGTGTSTGTQTSSTSAVMNDTTQTWTSNALKGLLFQSSNFTSPTPIVANTATSITSISAQTPTGTYTIWDWGTTILCNCTATATNSLAGCVYEHGSMQGTAAASSVGVVRVKWMKFNTGLGGNIAVQIGAGNMALFDECQFYLATAGSSVTLVQSGSTVGSSTFNPSRCYFNIEKAGGTGSAVAGNNWPVACYFKGGNNTQTVFNILSGPETTVYTASVNVFETLASVISMTAFAATPRPGQLYGTFINNTTVFTGQGIWSFRDSVSNFPSFPLVSAGNTTFITTSGFLKANIGSDIPSGLATTDLSINGATSTLTAMRSSSPAVFPTTPNAYGSCAYA